MNQDQIAKLREAMDSYKENPHDAAAIGKWHGAIIQAGPALVELAERTTAPVSLTDAQIEALAVKHESFGFGQAGKKSKLSIHGFEPEGLREFARVLLAAAPAPIQQELQPTDVDGLPQLPADMDIAEKINLSTIDSPEFLEKLGEYASNPNLDTAWAVLQCADRKLHHIIKRRFEIARGEPIAHLRFRAAQQWSGVGGSDIEYAEWYETCHAHEVGDDKQPAFPVYAATPPALAGSQVQAAGDARVQQWERACREIIDRCVAPDMYRNAREMLDRAVAEALRTLP